VAALLLTACSLAAARCQAGEYHFRFMVGDSTDLHPVMAVSDKYEREEVPNREGQRVMCNKVRHGAAPSRAYPSCLLAAVRTSGVASEGVHSSDAIADENS
jgi:hypothetical protein